MKRRTSANVIFQLLGVLTCLGLIWIIVFRFHAIRAWKVNHPDLVWSVDFEIARAMVEFNCSKTRLWLASVPKVTYGRTFLRFFLRRRFARMRAGIDPFRILVHPPVGGLGNVLRGLLSTLVLSIFTKSVTLVNGGLTDLDSVHFLDSFSFIDGDLQSWSRFDDCSFAYLYGTGRFKGMSLDDCTSSSDGDPLVLRALETGKSLLVQEIDGENTHLCVSTSCRFLSDRRDSALLESLFLPGEPSPSGLVLVNADNNFYLPHIFRSEKKTRILCEVFQLCDSFDFRPLLEDVPFFGSQYGGSRLAGNLFQSLFKLNPRIEPEILSGIERLFSPTGADTGLPFVLALQVRASWIGNEGMFWTPQWSEFVDCLEGVVNERMLDSNAHEATTVYIASDEPVPEAVLDRISRVAPTVRVLSREDFYSLGVGGGKKKSLSDRINEKSVRMATIFEFEVLRRANVSIVTFFSSYGHMATIGADFFPPYVVFGKSVLPARHSEVSCVRPRIYSYWRTRIHDLDPFQDWVFDIRSLERD